jgi:hypothetical protein
MGREKVGQIFTGDIQAIQTTCVLAQACSLAVASALDSGCVLFAKGREGTRGGHRHKPRGKSGRPCRAPVSTAASGWKEPFLTDAALCSNQGSEF